MTEIVQPGTWVRIHQAILAPSERAPGLPPETACVPYECWIKGFLVEPAVAGGAAVIETPAGRRVTGRLVAALPGHDHTFGPPHPAMLAVGPTLRKLLSDGDAGR